MKTIYIAGKISGDEDYVDKFMDAEYRLQQQNYIVLNPAILPSEGLSYAACIRVSKAMMIECAAVYMLRDWQESAGAKKEHRIAKKRGLDIIYEEEER